VTATVTSAGDRLPALAAPIACGCCLLAGAAYVTAVDPAAGGGFLPCPFRTLTGWWCPGCGLTRATHHLFRGDLAQALRFNLFVVLILAGLSLTWLAWALQTAGRPIRRIARIPSWVYAACITVLIAYAVVRNLPGIPGLRG
jgi:hypothetical protein